MIIRSLFITVMSISSLPLIAMNKLREQRIRTIKGLEVYPSYVKTILNQKKITSDGTKQDEKSFVDTHDIVTYVVKNSHLKIDWKKFTPRGELLERTNCHHTARFIVNLLTNTNTVSSINLANEHFSTFGDFTKKEKHTYTNQLAKQLFSYGDKQENSVFYVNLVDGFHGFVVVKTCDGSQTWWRIYQSWFNLFSANEWLDEKEWKKNESHRKSYKLFKENENIFKKYGQGRILSSKSVMQFLEDNLSTMKSALPSDPILKNNLSENTSSLQNAPIYIMKLNGIKFTLFERFAIAHPLKASIIDHALFVGKLSPIIVPTGIALGLLAARFVEFCERYKS